MYLYIFCFVEKKKRYGEKDNISKKVYLGDTYVYVLVSVLCSTYVCMDP